MFNQFIAVTLLCAVCCVHAYPAENKKAVLSDLIRQLKGFRGGAAGGRNKHHDNEVHADLEKLKNGARDAMEKFNCTKPGMGLDFEKPASAEEGFRLLADFFADLEIFEDMVDDEEVDLDLVEIRNIIGCAYVPLHVLFKKMSLLGVKGLDGRCPKSEEHELSDHMYNCDNLEDNLGTVIENMEQKITQELASLVHVTTLEDLCEDTLAVDNAMQDFDKIVDLSMYCWYGDEHTDTDTGSDSTEEDTSRELSKITKLLKELRAVTKNAK